MPRLVYMLVALLIAYKIVQFWVGIYWFRHGDLSNISESYFNSTLCACVYQFRPMTLTELLANEELRQREFPVAREKIFLAHAGDCPLPRRVAEAIANSAPGDHAGDQGSSSIPASWKRDASSAPNSSIASPGKSRSSGRLPSR